MPTVFIAHLLWNLCEVIRLFLLLRTEVNATSDRFAVPIFCLVLMVLLLGFEGV